MEKESIKTKFVVNKDYRLTRTAFLTKLNMLIHKLNENHIVLTYKIRENDYHQISGAYIRYINKS